MRHCMMYNGIPGNRSQNDHAMNMPGLSAFARNLFRRRQAHLS